MIDLLHRIETAFGDTVDRYFEGSRMIFPQQPLNSWGDQEHALEYARESAPLREEAFDRLDVLERNIALPQQSVDFWGDQDHARELAARRQREEILDMAREQEQERLYRQSQNRFYRA